MVLLIDKNGRVGLLKKWQPQPPDPNRWYEEFPNYNVEELGRWCYEAVGEMGEKGEDPFQTARRGVKEETGLEIRRLCPLGPGCSAPASIVTMDFYFLALVKPSQKARPLDDTEGIHGRAEFFTRKQVEKLIKSGELYDSRTKALLLAYWTGKRKKQVWIEGL